jgi:hypothetical protein
MNGGLRGSAVGMTRHRLCMVAVAVMTVVGLAACGGSTAADRKWLRELERDDVISRTPASFSETSRNASPGYLDYMGGQHRRGSSLVVRYTPAADIGVAVNDWAEALTATGWTVRRADCRPPQGVVWATKRIGDFDADATVYVRTDYVQLDLDAPPSDQPTSTMRPAQPPVGRC